MSLALAACLFSFLEAHAETVFQPQYGEVRPGLAYAHVLNTNGPWSIHIARLDRRRSDYSILTSLARGSVEGICSVSEQMRALAPSRLEPVAAVNGDFFVINRGPYQGDPNGLQIMDGELLSAPSRFALCVSGRHLRISQTKAGLKLKLPAGISVPMGLNEQPTHKRSVLFTPRFGHFTKATNLLELVLEPSAFSKRLPLRANTSYKWRVRSINANGNSPILPGTMVATVASTHTNLVKTLKPGSPVEISTTLEKGMESVESAVGGWPLLVHEGREESFESGKGAPPRHPRTAVGFNNQYFYLAEVDGRQTNLSIGMTFAELAGLMRQLGCSEALNLDGGGSSTFWLAGKTMNSPSDKRERSVANALVIARRKR